MTDDERTGEQGDAPAGGAGGGHGAAAGDPPAGSNAASEEAVASGGGDVPRPEGDSTVERMVGEGTGGAQGLDPEATSTGST